ncbi:MAG: hypothetical protein P1V35_07195, partial [Planctomycetota bacterium]|nr:hypothetical protein [Planctomycetota bacterium]
MADLKDLVGKSSNIRAYSVVLAISGALIGSAPFTGLLPAVGTWESVSLAGIGVLAMVSGSIISKRTDLSRKVGFASVILPCVGVGPGWLLALYGYIAFRNGGELFGDGRATHAEL